MPRNAVYERRMKVLVLHALRKRGLLKPGDIISSEFVLAGQGRRADLAFLGRRLIGIEIKSERDTLQRLSPQLQAYSRCFDKVLLVVAPKHLNQAVAVTPPGIEVWSVDAAGKVSVVKKATAGPALQAEDLIKALTREELRKSFPHSPAVTVRMARKALHEAFSNRFGETSAFFWSQVSEDYVSSEDLERLSRFAERRRAYAEAANRKREFWDAWQCEAARIFGPAGGHAS